MMLQKFMLLAAAAVLLPAQTPTSGGNTYLGVWIWQVDAERAQQLRLPETMGVEITRVREGSPADQAGLKSGDVVTHYNGERIRNMDHFSTLVRDTRAGTKVDLQVYRNGAPLSITARIAAVKSPKSAFSAAPRGPIVVPDLPRTVTTWRSPMLGMDAESIEGQLAAYFGVTSGVLVRSVARGSAAERAGLKAGDVITAVGGVRVDALNEITLRMRNSGASTATLQVVRDRKEISVTIDTRQ